MNNVNLNTNIEHPMICVLGRMGSGKTLFTTYLAKKFEEFCTLNDIDNKVFANYTLNLDLFEKVKIKDIVSFPEWLQNGILILDEIQSEGGDSYKFLSKISKHLTSFLTQVRKRNLAFVYTTQHIKLVNNRIRLLTSHVIQITNLSNGKVKLTFWDWVTKMVLGETVLDLTDCYDLYDTKELITQEEIDNQEKELEDFLKQENKTE